MPSVQQGGRILRINTEGDQERRLARYDKVGEIVGENTRSKAIDRACDHIIFDVRAKGEAIQWARENLTTPEAKELADILSTPQVRLSVRTETNVEAGKRK